MTDNIEPVSELGKIIQLLTECGLPVEDISDSHAPNFFGIRKESDLSGVIGLEFFGTVAMLRSLAVSPKYRGNGLARQLVAYAESFALSKGVNELYLLTTTASGFFEKSGYKPLSRFAAPPAIQATPQFSRLCPESSAFLHKLIIHSN